MAQCKSDICLSKRKQNIKEQEDFLRKEKDKRSELLYNVNPTICQ